MRVPSRARQFLRHAQSGGLRDCQHYNLKHSFDHNELHNRLRDHSQLAGRVSDDSLSSTLVVKLIALLGEVHPLGLLRFRHISVKRILSMCLMLANAIVKIQSMITVLQAVRFRMLPLVSPV